MEALVFTWFQPDWPIKFTWMGPDARVRAIAKVKPESVAAVIAPASVGAGADIPNQVFTPTDGQSVFVLSITPPTPTAVRIIINGVIYGQSNFTIAGTTLTWSQPFTIMAGDTVEVSF
jgi:hypothetical protein